MKCAPPSLGGWGIIVSFYSVQDCPRTTLALQEAISAIQITSDLLSHVQKPREKNVSRTKI